MASNKCHCGKWAFERGLCRKHFDEQKQSAASNTAASTDIPPPPVSAHTSGVPPAAASVKSAPPSYVRDVILGQSRLSSVLALRGGTVVLDNLAAGRTREGRALRATLPVGDQSEDAISAILSSFPWMQA